MFAGLNDLLAACSEEGDRRAGWNFVRALTATLGRPVTESDGIDAEPLQIGEERIGLALPAALREAYLLFGRRQDLTATQDRLIWPQNLRGSTPPMSWSSG